MISRHFTDRGKMWTKFTSTTRYQLISVQVFIELRTDNNESFCQMENYTLSLKRRLIRADAKNTCSRVWVQMIGKTFYVNSELTRNNVTCQTRQMWCENCVQQLTNHTFDKNICAVSKASLLLAWNENAPKNIPSSCILRGKLRETAAENVG